MEKTIQQQKNRQKKLAILLVGLLLVAGGVLFFGFGLGGGSSSSQLTTSSAGGPLTSSVRSDRISGVSLDLSVFQNPAFLSLEIFGELPIIVGDTGRTNPFVAPGF